MSSSITVNGNTYIWPDQFLNYQYVTTWPAFINDCIAQFVTYISSASASAVSAAASAVTAAASPATQGTSTTSLTIGLGTQSLNIQAGKGFLPGMPIRIAKSDGSLNWMDGSVTSYNSSTGALVASVRSITGSGAFSSWNVFLEGAQAAVSGATTPNNLSTFLDTIGTQQDSGVAISSLATTSQLRSYLAGLSIAPNATNPTTQIDFSPGVAADSGNAYIMSLPALMTKTLQSTGAWAAGSGGNGLFSGAKAPGATYHAFSIRNTATGVIDCGFDTSVSAANIPSGYSAYRRLGSFLTDGSSLIRPFIQIGDIFKLLTEYLDRNSSATASWALLTFTVPTGLVVAPIININQTNGAGGSAVIYFGDATDTSQARSLTVIWNLSENTTQTGMVNGVLFTNTSSQLYFACGGVAYASCQFVTLGWIDRRGKDA